MAGIALSIFIYWQQSRAERKAQRDRNDAIETTAKKVSEDVAATLKKQYEPTVADLKRQVADLQDQLISQGKNVEAIRGSNIVSGKQPIKVEVTNPSPGTTQEPPILADVRIASQRRTVSTDPNYPYALEIIIQTNQQIQPVAFAVECDGEVGRGSAGFSGSGMYTNVRDGIAAGHNNIFIFQWETPAFSPDMPITVTLLSKTAIRARQLHKLPFKR